MSWKLEIQFKNFVMKNRQVGKFIPWNHEMNFKLEFPWIYLIKNQPTSNNVEYCKIKYVSMSLYFIHYPNLWIMLQHKKMLRHISPNCDLNTKFILSVEFWLFAKEVFNFLPYSWNPSSHSFHPLESTQKSMKDKTKETKTKHIKT